MSPRTSSPAMRRIIADNDRRNGSFVTRLMRVLEQPDRRPDADGLYRDAPRRP